jgi:hypothetical protein
VASPVNLYGLIKGYNGYSLGDILDPTSWAPGTLNVYASQAGIIQRYRSALVVEDGVTTGIAVQDAYFDSIFYYRDTPVVASLVSFSRTANAATITVGIGIGGTAAFPGTVVTVVGCPDPSFNGTYVLLGSAGPTAGYPNIGPDVASTPATVGTATFYTDVLLGDINGKLFSFIIGDAYLAVQRINIMIDPAGTGSGLLGGVWTRIRLLNQVFEMNGAAKQKGLSFLGQRIENWGLDAPDTSAQVTIQATPAPSTIQSVTSTSTGFTATIRTAPAHGLSTGMWVTITITTPAGYNGTYPVTVIDATHFTVQTALPNLGPVSAGGPVTPLQITTVTGRSYVWAWVNEEVGNTSPPSPATQYVAYTAQEGLLEFIQPGTVAATLGSNAIVGTGTAFTSAWIGRRLWIETIGILGGGIFDSTVTAVTDTTHLTIRDTSPSNAAGAKFQVFDPQVASVYTGTAGHIKIYATADGGPTYFHIAETVFDPVATTVAGAGLSFVDNASQSPPDAPFTSEVPQFFNVPPPIGRFVQEYQSRALVYGVGGLPSTFFYSNIELTDFGNLPEDFAPLNQITLPMTGQLFGMANLPTGLMLWSDHQDMFKLTGLLSDNSLQTDIQLGAVIQRLPFNIGCASPFTVQVTSLGAIWLTSDHRIMLYTDHYAPKNIGLSVQDILKQIPPAAMPNARSSYFQYADKNWYALAIKTDANSPTNDTLLVLDLDLLASNGQESFFTFDMASNQPTWYVFSVEGSCLETIFDGTGAKHLLAGGLDLIRDLTYETGYFGTEESVTGGQLITHNLGGTDPESIKEIDLLRFRVNPEFPTTPSVWQFFVRYVDDDVQQFDDTSVPPVVVPQHNVTSGVDSPTQGGAGGLPLVTTSPLRFGPNDFKFEGSRQISGRRFRFGVVFPSEPGAFQFRGLTAYLVKNKPN